MRRFRSHRVGVDQGSSVLFSDHIDGGPMWTGSGAREFRFPVTFSEAYVDPPVVQVSMTMWDSDHQTNQRVDIQPEEITETGFTIVFRTWGDTRIARVRASWTAIGEIRDEDDWDLY
ncbi:MAG: H-type lectin domain-containing protein [Paracoccaceae bacterium]